MATGGGTEEQQQFSLLGKTLKEGERLLAPTRRPDGTLRKPIRIRAGYVPQDEVAIYQSKGALLRKGLGTPEFLPGYDPVLDAKLKSKSARKNERKKEKKQQAALEKGKNLESNSTGEVPSAEDVVPRSEAVESVAHQMNTLAVSEIPSVVAPSADSTECSSTWGPGPDIDKRIRALKKKIRLTEAQLQKTEQIDMKPGQLEKEAKMERLCEELKLLEDEKAELAAS
ncbi:partner of Y14 and mago-like isoform X3 [Telopea speciosissima]|uniref:partner of Y14 and mago-like isoform X3 n=1 Tax=Telopea speciosissima TaxID=54955 RepID=UPI001CC405A4|nr:partner of Y14 and mago-like isoform X3 [Telopea speciosissima]